MEYLDYPVLWIPTKWPLCMEFINCRMGAEFIDPPLSDTEKLQIIDTPSLVNGPTNLIEINWSKLPKLKELYIRAEDIILDDLQKNCPDLEIICIDLENRNRMLPPMISKLSKLKKIITNSFTDKEYHFVSPNLELCLVPKKKKFTTCSKLVPPIQLLENMYINMH